MRRIPLILALLLALLTGAAQGVTQTAWNPDVHRAVLIVSQDDWVDSTLLAAADSLDVPMVFNIGASFVVGNTLKEDRVREAWAHGHDIGVHTGAVNIDTMTTAQVQAMFNTNDASISTILRQHVGGPLEARWFPDSWCWHGNAWTPTSLALAKAHYNTVRVGKSSTSATGLTLAYPDTPTGGLGSNAYTPYSGRGRGIPMLMAERDRLTWAYPCPTCDEAASDTTGIGAYLWDLVQMRGIGEVNCHGIGYASSDLSKLEFCDLMGKAIADGRIWITTPRQLYADPYFKEILDRENDSPLYISATASAMGKGTFDDPAHIFPAVAYTWARTIQCKTDETYEMWNLVDPAVDLNVLGNITVKGPSTWKFWLKPSGATGVVAASTTILKCTPGADSYCDDSGHEGTYPRGKRQVWSGLTFESFGNAYAGGSETAAVVANGKRVWFEDNRFVIRAMRGIVASSGGAALHLVRNTMELDTTAASIACLSVTAANDTSLVLVGNTFSTEPTSSAVVRLFYRESAPSATIADTLCNNIWWNPSSSTVSTAIQYYAESAAAPIRYNVFAGGNLMRSGSASTVMNVKLRSHRSSGSATWAAAMDTLDAKIVALRPATADSLKDWAVTYNPSGRDTLKWGGVALGAVYGTTSRWGSIGPTQYTEAPVVTANLPARMSATTRVESPWKLLALVNAGVLPVSDSLNAATWYPIRCGASDPEKAQYQLFRDAYQEWPVTTRQKIRWRPE